MTVTGPDPAGAARLAAAARELTPYVPPTRRRRRLPVKWVVAFVIVDVVVGSVLWHVISRTQDSPVDAVRTVATLAGNGDWAGVYDHLCRADHEQFSAADIAEGGDGALGLLHGLAEVRLGAAHSVTVHLVGPLSLPAKQVAGTLVPRLGPPIDFTVTTVRDLGGWRVCLSVGGYSAPAFGVDEPLG